MKRPTVLPRSGREPDQCFCRVVGIRIDKIALRVSRSWQVFAHPPAQRWPVLLLSPGATPGIMQRLQCAA